MAKLMRHDMSGDAGRGSGLAQRGAQIVAERIAAFGTRQQSPEDGDALRFRPIARQRGEKTQ